VGSLIGRTLGKAELRRRHAGTIDPFDLAALKGSDFVYQDPLKIGLRSWQTVKL
jgi:hypothetical protein